MYMYMYMYMYMWIRNFKWSGLRTNRQQPMDEVSRCTKTCKVTTEHGSCHSGRKAANFISTPRTPKWQSYSYAVTEGEARIWTGTSWKHRGMHKRRASMERRARCRSQPTPAAGLGSLEMALSSALGWFDGASFHLLIMRGHLCVMR
jgi:hypothetical protein